MKKCSPEELSLKSYFLGPQAENSSFLKHEAATILEGYLNWRKKKFPFDGAAISEADKATGTFMRAQQKTAAALSELSRRFHREIPQFSPRYMAHMFSEMSIPGLLGHWLALLHNPNNISQESSRVGVQIEREAIQSLCQIFGWKKGAGHFTSGGSIANLEAMLRMRERIAADPRRSKAVLLVSQSAHYSWKKALGIAGFPESHYIKIPLDEFGRMNCEALAKKLDQCRRTKTPVLGVVSLFGSTELGTVDDIAGIQKVINAFDRNLWHHVDAAYGGYFATVAHSKGTHLQRQSKALAQVSSLTLDPHKLGYVPYACGAFLCRSERLYHYAESKVPYIQFDQKKDRGLQTIEGSRPATGSAAVWVVGKTLGYHAKGLGKILSRHLQAKEKMRAFLQSEVSSWIEMPGLDLNVLCWTLGAANFRLSECNRQVEKIYAAAPGGKKPYYVARTTLSLHEHPHLKKMLAEKGVVIDTHQLVLVRMTLMNPFASTRESETEFLKEFATLLRKSLRGKFQQAGRTRRLRSASLVSATTLPFAHF